MEGPEILVVDDDGDAREIAAEILRNGGYGVSFATTGREAIDQVGTRAPGAILLDLELPDMSGYQVIERLRADSTTRSIPVIAFTAHALDGYLDRAREAGCTAVLIKPCRPSDVLLTVRALLAQKPWGGDPGRGGPGPRGSRVSRKDVPGLASAYRRRLPRKLAQIDNAWKNLQKTSWNEAAVRDLASRLHRLAGSAGMYGFGAVGRAARRAERLLDPWLGTRRGAPEETLRRAIEGSLRDLAALVEHRVGAPSRREPEASAENAFAGAARPREIG